MYRMIGWQPEYWSFTRRYSDMHRVAIDFDDVIAGFNQAFIPYMNGILGTEVTYETHRSFFFPDVYGVPLEQMLEHLADFCHNGGHDTITPIAGAAAALRLLEAKYELHLVTSRCESLASVTCDWLSAYGLNVFTDYHFTNAASLMYPKRKRLKSQFCQELGVIALFEDALHNANEVAEAGIPVIMPTRPWNAEHTVHPKVLRSSGWKAGCNQLRQIAV